VATPLKPSQPKPKVRHLFKTAAETGSGGNVVLNFTGRPKQELALIGDVYHRAGRALVDRFGVSGAYSDLEAYPIVFLYRHAIELLIKGILTIGNDLAGLLDDESIRTANPYQDHSLARHLAKIRSIFEAVEWKHAFETAGMSSDQFGTIIREFEGSLLSRISWCVQKPTPGASVSVETKPRPAHVRAKVSQDQFSWMYPTAALTAVGQHKKSGASPHTIPMSCTQSQAFL